MSSDSSSCSPAFRTSQSTSVLPDPISSSGDSNHRTTQSASRLPFLPLHNGIDRSIAIFLLVLPRANS